MGENLRFVLAGVLLVSGMITVLLAVLGANKFRFVMNRMHSAAIIDSMGLLLILAGLCVVTWNLRFIPKLILILIFQWLSSPIASHMVARLEVQTDDTLYEHVQSQEEGDTKRHELY